MLLKTPINVMFLITMNTLCVVLIHSFLKGLNSQFLLTRSILACPINNGTLEAFSGQRGMKYHYVSSEIDFCPFLFIIFIMPPFHLSFLIIWFDFILMNLILIWSDMNWSHFSWFGWFGLNIVDWIFFVELTRLLLTHFPSPSFSPQDFSSLLLSS